VRAGRENVIILSANFIKNFHAAPAKQIEVERKAAVYHFDKRQTLTEQTFRHRYGFHHDRTEAMVELK
jgi:hypothetical protein